MNFKTTPLHYLPKYLHLFIKRKSIICTQNFNVFFQIFFKVLNTELTH